MPTIRELARYLRSRETIFTCVLFLLYAVTIHYCAQVGVDDVNRYERFDSDEHIPFDVQVAARFANYSVYEPHGAHRGLTTIFHGGMVQVRVVALSESNLDTARDALAREGALWTPVERQAAPPHMPHMPQVPVVLLFTESLNAGVAREASQQTTAAPDGGRSLQARVCQGVAQLVSAFPQWTFATLSSSSEACAAVRACAPPLATARESQWILGPDDIPVVRVSNWAAWLTELWDANHTRRAASAPTNNPEVFRAGLLIFAEPFTAAMAPRTIVASLGKVCDGVTSTTKEELLSLQRLCSSAEHNSVGGLACCGTLLHAMATLAKAHYQVDGLHGLLPTADSLPELGIHWMSLSGNAAAYLVSLIPRTPIAVISN